MIQFDLPKEHSSIIKVIGVGGGGSNAVNYMHSLGIEGVDFLVCNTDSQALSLSRVPNKVQLGPSLTQGLGAGANPEIGRQATEESLDEIRRILEVNTKMAFVTAGMGGGTGTGGAPIIARICRDMGILTVGIVTTPFSYEGKKRGAHADEGIKQMKSCVDTLLVISNDKLRHQFGNLTMSAALSTADNVLATAAKCITDVINTTGQINVDFADVCTVMRNGGVAILGSARAKGEQRAQLAIEQALNSPLLNDNDIRGAKWVLININSRAGENEFTMDEVETIQEYLLTQAGPDADVILGLGYDDSLGDEISITIIATGFEKKSVSGEAAAKPMQQPAEDKILFTLDVNPQPRAELISILPAQELPVQELPAEETVAQVETVGHHEEEPAMVLPVAEALSDDLTNLEVSADADATEEISGSESPVVFELEINASESIPVFDLRATEQEQKEEKTDMVSLSEQAPVQVNQKGFLMKPSQIYISDSTAETQLPAQQEEIRQQPTEPAQQKADPVADEQPFEAPVAQQIVSEQVEEETFELVFHEQECPDEVKAFVPDPEPQISMLQESAPLDEAELQKAKAAERLHKLRNLSYNYNAADPNNEYDSIPAYVRHNLQVHNTTLASVEKFYSSYAVGTDENNVTQISTINTFLEGKKPD